MTPDARKNIFIANLKKVRQKAEQDNTLRWNQIDVIDHAIGFLNAKEGAPLNRLGNEVPEREKAKRKSDADIALIESSPGSGKTRIMGVIAKTAADAGL